MDSDFAYVTETLERMLKMPEAKHPDLLVMLENSGPNGWVVPSTTSISQG